MKIDNPIRIFHNASELKDYLEPQRSQGKTLVTTNGCFDIVHQGHIQYLTEAARLGDILVIGVNSDETVRRLKGPSRPVRNETDRVTLLGTLRMVDAAFIFNEDDPRAFLEILRPDIHVKGGDYSKDILERQTVEQFGGRIEIVSYLEGYSSSTFVRKIRGG